MAYSDSCGWLRKASLEFRDEPRCWRQAVGLRGVVQGKEDSRNVDHAPLGKWQKSSARGRR